jgi:hypothetical protein
VNHGIKTWKVRSLVKPWRIKKMFLVISRNEKAKARSRNKK